MKISDVVFTAAGNEYLGRVRFNQHMIPAEHQKKAMMQIGVRSRYGLFDEAGTGKTLPSQVFLLMNKARGLRTIVIMPPSILYQYQKEFERSFEFELEVDRPTVEIFNLTPAKRKEFYRKGDYPDVLMMSYQMFTKVAFPDKTKGQEFPFHEHYSCIVCDESHSIKNPDSKAFRSVAYFLRKAEEGRALLMTGTPFHRDVMDGYAQIKLLSPPLYGSLAQYKRMHGIFQQIRVGEKLVINKLVGVCNKGLLNSNLYKNGQRTLRRDVLDLHKPQIIDYHVELSSKHHKLYRKLVNEMMMELDNGGVIDATNQSSLRMKALRLVTNPLSLDESVPFKDSDNVIKDTLQTLVDSKDPWNTKVLIYAHFQDSVRSAAKWLEEYNPALVYGNSNVKENLDKFLNDDSCRVMIANYTSGGVGLNLQSVCHDVIFLEPVSTPGAFEQAFARVDRKGQTEPVTVTLLRVTKTISPKLIDTMMGRVKDNLGALGDKDSVLNELLGGS